MAYRGDGDNQLFREHLSDHLRQRDAELAQAVERTPPDRLLDTPLESWVEHFVERFRIEPVALQADQIETSGPTDTQLDISRDRRFAPFFFDERSTAPALAVTFHVPFTGEGQLLAFRPSSFYMNPMRASVKRSELTMTYIEPASVFEQSAGGIKQEFEHEFGLIRQVAANIDGEVNAWNEGVRSRAEALLRTRLQRLQASTEAIGSFGFPVRRRDDAPSTYLVPDVRRKVSVLPPPAKKESRAPDPAIDMMQYEEILGICSSMVRVMERSPGDFSSMGEETLRSHFLVQLNGQFEGRATGETFNASGKTDILIRHGDRNLFIAECKFWRGKDSLIQAIDQLLGYATWRDGKLALLVFNRNKDFSAVVAQIPEVVRAHTGFRGERSCSLDTSFRATLCHRDDADRELILTVLAFDVPRPGDEG